MDDADCHYHGYLTNIGIATQQLMHSGVSGVLVYMELWKMNKNGIMEVTLSKVKAAHISEAGSVWQPAVTECKQEGIITIKM